MARKIDLLLQDYADYHQTAGNVRCHFVGIPLIVYSILALLMLIPLFEINGYTVTAAEALTAGAFVYYLTLNVPLAISMLLFSVGCIALARFVNDYRLALALFIIGWIFQGIGHAVYEKRSPAFLRNLVHLMVGPVFLLNEALKIRPVGSKLA